MSPDTTSRSLAREVPDSFNNFSPRLLDARDGSPTTPFFVNFSMLSKNNPEIDNKQCIIYESIWEEYKNELIYTIKANRFLHHMVRFIVGSSVEVAQSKIKYNEFVDLINNRATISPLCAPSKGLFLNEVIYD